MSYVATLACLLVAALLEAGGDALVRVGLHGSSGWARAATLGAGGLVLFAYGCVVNAPSWDFGRLLGVYIVFFFLAAQGIGWLVFGQFPRPAVWLGGALIVIGGATISFTAR